MKILITGASGLLGSKIIKLNKDYEIISTYNSHYIPNSVKLDVTDKQQVLDLFNRLRPDIVIHAAAMTNLDECETQQQRAWLINVMGTRNIAMVCNKLHLKLIYISTSCVFDGEKGNYIESDKTNPKNYYGTTKLGGELAVIRYFNPWLLSCRLPLILRTTVLYGWYLKQNFVREIIDTLEQNKEIDVIDDLYNTPTYVNNFVEIMFDIIERNFMGVYHVSGNQTISRYEFAKKIAEVFDLDQSLINPVKMEEMKKRLSWIAERPRDVSLNADMIRRLLRTKPLNVTEGLKRMRRETFNRNENTL